MGFEANLGQAPGGVQFLARGPNYGVMLNGGGGALVAMHRPRIPPCPGAPGWTRCWPSTLASPP